MLTYNYALAFFADLGYTKICRSPNIATELWVSRPDDESVRLVISPSHEEGDGHVGHIELVDDDCWDHDITLYTEFNGTFDETTVIAKIIIFLDDKREFLQNELDKVTVDN